MFGLLILVAVYVILGFMLAWIVGIVAQEEISIGQGVLVLILSAIVTIAVSLALAQIVVDPTAYAGLRIALNLCTIAVFTKLIAHIGWKESFIISTIYATLLFVIGLILPF
jgi:hypothetical protein